MQNGRAINDQFALLLRSGHSRNYKSPSPSINKPTRICALIAPGPVSLERDGQHVDRHLVNSGDRLETLASGFGFAATQRTKVTPGLPIAVVRNGGVKADMLMRMQTAYDMAHARAHADDIMVDEVLAVVA